MLIAIIVIVLVSVVVISPFVLTKPMQLQEAATVDSIEELERVKASLLKRYLEDEKALQDKLISERVWQKRKHYLSSRYIDAARREDYLKFLEQAERS